MKYKLILFDLGGVVFTNGTKKFIEWIAEKKQADRDWVGEVVDGDLGTVYREGQITKHEYWQKLREALSLTEPAEELEERWIGFYEVIEGTKQLIGELKEKGYRVWYLSDNVPERVEGLNKRFSFLGWFDAGVFAHETGVRKPDPTIFTYTVRKAGVMPEETIFIDDKTHCVVPANALGMEAILFENPEQVRWRMVELGVV